MNREPLHQAEWIVLKPYHLVFLTDTFKMHLELLSTHFMIIRCKAKMLLKYRLIGEERLTKDTQMKEDKLLSNVCEV